MSALGELAPPEVVPEEREERRAFRLDGYYLSLGVIVLLAGLLRFWDLGSRAMHHDESLHALYSWYLYVGRGYQHDPLMHGPFQFHGIAFIYFMLGASDYTARVLAAGFGTAAVLLPHFLRPWLGRWGALSAVALLAFSPLMLYYSRFARGDILIVVWNLAIVIAMWRYQLSQDRRYLYLGAAALALAFATKEVTYLTAGIFGSYLLVTCAPEIVSRIRAGLDFRGASPRTGFLLLLATLVLPQGAAGILIVLRFLGVDPVALGAWQSPDQPEVALFLHAGSDPARTFLLVFATLAPLVLLSCALAWRWNWRLWVGVAAFFYVPFVLLFTTFLTNLPGFGSGIWGGLEYWIAQQPVARGSQPWFYYLLLLGIYEFLPVLIGLSGAAWYFLRWKKERDPFVEFLVWWLVGSLILYGYAGEKMPWLSLHIVLPIALLAGKTAGAFAEGVRWLDLWKGRALFMAPLVVLALIGMRALVVLLDGLTPGAALYGHLLQALGAGGVVLAVLTGLYWIARSLPRRLLWQGSAAGLVMILAAFTLRAATQASYLHGDIPVEMMVYTQTSPDVPRIMRDIERVAAESGQGKNLAVTVDAHQGFTWPWAWYLRDYKNVDYPDLVGGAGGEPRGAVLLLNTNNRAAMEPHLSKYETGRPFPHRWWFPEFYKDTPVPELVQDLFTAEGIGRVWGYFYNRELGAPLGSSDALVYYPRGSGRASAQLPDADVPSGQATQTALRPIPVTAELVIGQRGAAIPGGLISPKGVAVDVPGNLYVVDSEAARVVKFDPSGNPVGQVGRRGAADGEFIEPWGIAVDSAGNVFVADTWNHRIQKFDSNLSFVTKWGSFASVPSGGSGSPGAFYGPRAIAVDAEGNVLVTDTGNKRVQKFTGTGQFLSAYGTQGRGQGQFEEPVGVAIASSGDIFVADTWNRRVQRFDSSFRYLGEFPVAGWAGQSVVNKPYIAIQPAGDLLLTDPESHRLLKYAATGAALSSFGRPGTDASSFTRPAAVAVDAQGRVYVSDSGNARVLRLPPLE